MIYAYLSGLVGVETPKKDSDTMGKTKADLENEVQALKAQIAAQGGVPPKEREAAETRAQGARAAVKGISVESVVRDITDLGLHTSRALAQLSETLAAKTRQLEEIDLAIQVKTQDLEVLLGKESVGSALAALIEDYERQRRELQEQIALARQAWEQEKQQYSKLLQERNAETTKARQREEEQFSYEREQRRRTEDTAWKNAVEDRKRAETLRAEQFERDLTARDSALKARENEYATALARFGQLQTEIDAAVKKEVASVTAAISREHKHQTELALMSHNSEIASLKAQIVARDAENARLLTQVTDLGTKLAAAHEKNLVVAEKALDAASGRQAMVELRDLATTRAESNGGGGGRKSS